MYKCKINLELMKSFNINSLKNNIANIDDVVSPCLIYNPKPESVSISCRRNI